MFGVPMGNLGDYVWGQNSFDDIITHIMEQNQGMHAPPPASEEAILKLPKRRIVASEADEKHECGICMDEYGAGNTVLTLPCKHFYHEECIDHWLKMNGTCPICRTRIDDRPNDGPYGAGVPLRPHSDLPGSFPASSPPPPAPPSSREAQGRGTGVPRQTSTSTSPPAPEPMD
ncbi:hypothetical protein H4R19_007100 [Coemansia spiralis]|nr:hypothetical protein H4R19_007100 [Coemansia spiralis]